VSHGESASSSVSESAVEAGKRLGLEVLMRMLGAGEQLELVDLGTTQAVARQHALHRCAQHLGWAPIELLGQRALAQAAGVAGMAVVPLLLELVARDRDLVAVQHDDVVAYI